MEIKDVKDAMREVTDPIVNEVKEFRRKAGEDMAQIQQTLDEHGQKISAMDERLVKCEQAVGGMAGEAPKGKASAAAMDADPGDGAALKAFRGLGYVPAHLSARAERRAIINGIAKHAEKHITKGSLTKLVKAILARDKAEIKALTGGTNSEGGFLIPVEHQAIIAEIVEQYGVAREAGATIIPMGTDEKNVPKLLTDVTASWSAENATTGESDAAFAQKTLYAKRLKLWTQVTTDLLQDSQPSIDAYLLKIFARAIAKAEDTAVFAGTGGGASDPHTGILSASGTNAVTAAGPGLGYEDLVALEAALTRGALSGASLFVSGKGKAKLRLVRDDNGMPIIVDAMGAAMPASLFGEYPIRRCEAGIPNNAGGGTNETRFILGNMENVFIGEREQVAIASSEHFKFTSDAVIIKASLREAITVVNPEGFAILSGVLAA